MHVGDMWVTQKLGFKKLSLSQVYAPRFQPVGDLVKPGIQKVEFKWSLCTQISPSWLLELKSGVHVKFQWSFEIQVFTQTGKNWDSKSRV